MKAVTTEQIRQLDQRAMAAGTPGAELMERAGFAVARAVSEFLPRQGSRASLLFAGKGNNGGDAFVAARHLAAAGCHATVVLLCRQRELQGDALTHFQNLIGVEVVEWPPPADDYDVVVDGLLGTGLRGEVREPYAAAIRAINESGLPVIAIDVPSGLDSDTGAVLGCAVRADLTVTMGLPKIGLLQPSAVDYVGRIDVADIGLPVSDVDSDIELLTRADFSLPVLRRSAHKGDCGHLLIVAGSEGYTGAPVLCATAAARSGVGLVTLAVPREIYPIVAAQCPLEVMPRPLEELDSLAKFDAAAIGPGLGQSPEAQSFVKKFLAGLTLPVVVDADALSVWTKPAGPAVLTPHPGEMARLVGKTAAEVQVARWDTARQFAREHKVTLALKGAGTVVTDAAGKLWINSTGNPGMAKGGMGDALTGIIGALLAQGMPALEAAKAGVFIHGRAGDLAAQRLGARAMLTTDLIEALSTAWQE